MEAASSEEGHYHIFYHKNVLRGRWGTVRSRQSNQSTDQSSCCQPSKSLRNVVFDFTILHCNICNCFSHIFCLLRTSENTVQVGPLVWIQTPERRDLGNGFGRAMRQSNRSLLTLTSVGLPWDFLGTSLQLPPGSHGLLGVLHCPRSVFEIVTDLELD